MLAEKDLNRKFDERRIVFSTGFVNSARYAFTILRNWMVTIILDFSVTQAESLMTLLRDCSISNVLFFPFHDKLEMLKSEILVFSLFGGNEFFWLVEFSAGIIVSQITDLKISILQINSIFPFRKLQIFLSFRKLQ